MLYDEIENPGELTPEELQARYESELTAVVETVGVEEAADASGVDQKIVAALAAGDCEMALGGDQGGSIRIPGSWCGVYGLKATHGLVPYTGVMPIELTIDHLGPITRTVADAARMLSVTADAGSAQA